MTFVVLNFAAKLQQYYEAHNSLEHLLALQGGYYSDYQPDTIAFVSTPRKWV